MIEVGQMCQFEAAREKGICLAHYGTDSIKVKYGRCFKTAIGVSSITENVM